MAEIQFDPTFSNLDFVDGKDLVSAEEPNGFNARVAAIENDLQQLSTVVEQVDVVVNRDASQRIVRLTVPPTLLALRDAWQADATGAVWGAPPVLAASDVNSVGTLAVTLPEHSTLLSFRVQGRAVGTSVTATLIRYLPSAGATGFLAAVTGRTDPFDESQSVVADGAVVTTATNQYLIQVPDVPGVSSTVRVSLAAFQITYSLP